MLSQLLLYTDRIIDIIISLSAFFTFSIKFYYFLFKIRKSYLFNVFYNSYIKLVFFSINNLKIFIMGKLKQGIFGSISGKVGNLVGASWKGISVIKSMPASVANPRTAKQVNQRTKFAFAVAFATLILADIIKPLWDRFSVKMSGFNSFVQANIDLFGDSYPDPEANLIISRGKMTATPISSVVAVNGDPHVTIHWLDDSGEGYKLNSDLAYVVATLNDCASVVVDAASESREGLSTIVTFAENLVTSDKLNIYLAFKRVDGTIVSNTSYLHKVV
jgi:hypothetical protein